MGGLQSQWIGFKSEDVMQLRSKCTYRFKGHCHSRMGGFHEYESHSIILGGRKVALSANLNGIQS